MPDAVRLHIRGVDSAIEGQFGKDLELLSGIMAIDVERWIGLSESILLCPGKGGIEIDVFLCHTREYVVAGPVENAREALDTIADQSIPERTDNWNSTANAGFKSQPNLLNFSCLHQAVAIECQ